VSKSKLLQKCNQCLSQRGDIPGAPLWHLGKVAVFESQESFNLIQNSIDYLVCKAKIQKSFTNDEKEFMKEFFEALWWGGQFQGFREAARLANHYVNGKGKSLRINEYVYKDSVIVKDTVSALKKYIKVQVGEKKYFAFLKTSDPLFLSSQQAKTLKANQRNVYTQGYLLNDGALLVEQHNLRLKNADHRFYITFNTSHKNNIFMSRWSIESLYDFEPFSSKKYVTDIPLLAKGFTIKLPDGLSHYLTKIGVANNFTYYTDWAETWR
jgi:hypothetical protein